MGNNAAIFDRLAGLETEYAIRFRPADLQASRPPKYVLFRALVLSLRRQLLTVEARHFKDGIFTATGGAVWFETERPFSDGGLIEGSTPECRGPRQVLTYQRAQDRLLSQAAEMACTSGEFTLLKNDRDSANNIYGAQENYEATLATGWRLAAWRIGLLMLLPLAMFTWLGFLLLIVATLAYVGIASLIYYPLEQFDTSRRLALWLFGQDVAEGSETGHNCPAWLATVLDRVTRVLTAPLTLLLLLLIRAFAFRRTRQALTPFLISRSVIAGAGMLDHDGKFHLADKAPAINCLIGLGGFLWDRPLYTFGHFFKTVFIEACFAPGDFFDLMRPRQRLQIALGDSNMADTAEYLRIGTTMLVLDCIEAGELPRVPRVRRPIQALHRLAADPSLTATARLSGSRQATAIELQRFYWEACRRFLQRRPDAPAEAHDVLERWGDVLDRLEHRAESLIGEIDWVTKRFLLDQAGSDANWTSRKKIDLRYHELADAGYFQRLRNGGHTLELLDEDDVERAMRFPPPDTPATTRGHYIREFGGGEQPVTANWKYVFLGEGSRSKVIRVADYGRAGVPVPKSRRGRKRGSDLRSGE